MSNNKSRPFSIEITDTYEELTLITDSNNKLRIISFVKETEEKVVCWECKRLVPRREAFLVYFPDTQGDRYYCPTCYMRLFDKAFGKMEKYGDKHGKEV
jgi:hypothetical protein